jgi:hypothetical protein
LMIIGLQAQRGGVIMIDFLHWHFFVIARAFNAPWCKHSYNFYLSCDFLNNFQGISISLKYKAN